MKFEISINDLAAKVIEDEKLITETERVAVLIADVFIENGVDIDGGVMNDYEPKNGRLDGDKHWWPQAEAMVGYYNAYHLTGNKKFYELSLGSWSFIKSKLKSPSGEWLWGIDEKEEPMIRNGKIGPWKGPYHNGRACMEILKRIR